ncbi:hypothetical protein IEQ34_014046 [Dendrobium chrysotoxum]|uniref:Secreted protein n=1 Tax=Dendrobium chrysotoxum TaxID=161865 RepID=A0AAV7GKD9_DENCH|nr:hypothetical protein IEQ34_014046 [Dendrobium chrysotoxum]
MALWKMPPRPMRSLKILLICKIVLFVFSDPLFVTSYTCSTTSFIILSPYPSHCPLDTFPQAHGVSLKITGKAKKQNNNRKTTAAENALQSY